MRSSTRRSPIVRPTRTCSPAATAKAGERWRWRRRRSTSRLLWCSLTTSRPARRRRHRSPRWWWTTRRPGRTTTSKSRGRQHPRQRSPLPATWAPTTCRSNASTPPAAAVRLNSSSTTPVSPAQRTGSSSRAPARTLWGVCRATTLMTTNTFVQRPRRAEQNSSWSTTWTWGATTTSNTRARQARASPSPPPATTLPTTAGWPESPARRPAPRRGISRSRIPAEWPASPSTSKSRPGGRPGPRREWTESSIPSTMRAGPRRSRSTSSRAGPRGPVSASSRSSTTARIPSRCPTRLQNTGCRTLPTISSCSPTPSAS